MSGPTPWSTGRRREFAPLPRSRPITNDALRDVAALLDAGEFDEARELLRTSVSHDDLHDARVWCLMARAELGRGDDVAALKATKLAVYLAPDWEWCHRLHSVALGRMNHEEQAVRSARMAVACEHLEPMTHIRLSECLVATLRLDEARAEALRAIRLAPDLAEAHLAHARALISLGRLDDARDAFEEVLAIDPDNASARNEVARFDLSERRWHKAVAGFDAAAAADPRSSRAAVANIEIAIRTAVAWMGVVVAVLAAILAAVAAHDVSRHLDRTAEGPLGLVRHRTGDLTGDRILMLGVSVFVLLVPSLILAWHYRRLDAPLREFSVAVVKTDLRSVLTLGALFAAGLTLAVAALLPAGGIVLTCLIGAGLALLSRLFATVRLRESLPPYYWQFPVRMSTRP